MSLLENSVSTNGASKTLYGYGGLYGMRGDMLIEVAVVQVEV